MPLINWNGPQPTPKEIGIDTPVGYLNDSWDIAVRLLDKGRKLYRQGNGLGKIQDNPNGFPGAWLPVSLGKRTTQIYPWDERDIRHSAKMIAYLWAEEPGLVEEYQRNLFIEQILENGDFLGHDGKVSPYANAVAMYACAAADMMMNFGIADELQEDVLSNIIRLIKRTCELFDPENSGLLNVGVGADWHRRGFWGTFLGEPDHFPANYDGKNKSVPATMSMVVFLKRFLDMSFELGEKAIDELGVMYERMVNAIEGPAWNELGDYYYIQRDDNSDRWFHSINGLCEDSRETDVVPYYAASACEIPGRITAVGRVINDAILKHRVFPMPTRYPAYPWYSPSHPNGIDMGEDCGQIGGAWDTPYFHCVQLLEKAGLQQALQRAVLRRAEVIHRDQDCLESYRLDGTVDHARFYNRDEYIVSATAHLSSIIEGLFGITPAKTGFAEVNIRPNLPLYRRHRHTEHPSQWAGRDNKIHVRLGQGKKLDLNIRYDEDQAILRLRTNNVGIKANIRLPLDSSSRFNKVLWGGKDVAARIEQGLDSNFIYVEHILDGEELRIEFTPYPEKNNDATPYINPQ